VWQWCCGRAGPVSPLGQTPRGHGVTYQGQLKENRHAGEHDYGSFEFKLFDAVTCGKQVRSVVALANVTVSNGLFTSNLDSALQLATDAVARSRTVFQDRTGWVT